jgi:hypothetical protein
MGKNKQLTAREVFPPVLHQKRDLKKQFFTVERQLPNEKKKLRTKRHNKYLARKGNATSIVRQHRYFFLLSLFLKMHCSATPSFPLSHSSLQSCLKTQAQNFHQSQTAKQAKTKISTPCRLPSPKIASIVISHERSGAW